MEIRSKTGQVHFTRWRIFGIKKWNINLYLHKIERADEEKHPHDHPWNFYSIILSGGYVERCGDKINVRRPGNIAHRKCTAFHKVLHLLGKRVYTLVFTYGKIREWGYDVDGEWVHKEQYRINKRLGLYS